VIGSSLCVPSQSFGFYCPFAWTESIADWDDAMAAAVPTFDLAG